MKIVYIKSLVDLLLVVCSRSYKYTLLLMVMSIFMYIFGSITDLISQVKLEENHNYYNEQLTCTVCTEP